MNLPERHKEEKDRLVLSPQHLNNILSSIYIYLKDKKYIKNAHSINYC